MAMTNLDVAKVYLHNQLIVFLQEGRNSFDEFRAQNQSVINAMHFTAAQQDECFLEAGTVFGAIQDAIGTATDKARKDILEKLKE